MIDSRDRLIVELIGALMFMAALVKEAEALVRATRENIAALSMRVDAVQARL